MFTDIGDIQHIYVWTSEVIMEQDHCMSLTDRDETKNGVLKWYKKNTMYK